MAIAIITLICLKKNQCCDLTSLCIGSQTLVWGVRNVLQTQIPLPSAHCLRLPPFLFLEKLFTRKGGTESEDTRMGGEGACKPTLGYKDVNGETMVWPHMQIMKTFLVIQHFGSLESRGRFGSVREYLLGMQKTPD